MRANLRSGRWSPPIDRAGLPVGTGSPTRAALTFVNDPCTHGSGPGVIAAVVWRAIALGSGAIALGRRHPPHSWWWLGRRRALGGGVTPGVAAELHAEAMRPAMLEKKSRAACSRCRCRRRPRSSSCATGRPGRGDRAAPARDRRADRVVKTSRCWRETWCATKRRRSWTRRSRPPCGPGRCRGKSHCAATGAAGGSAASAGTPEGAEKKPLEPRQAGIVTVTPPEKAVTPMAVQPPPAPRPCAAIQANARFIPWWSPCSIRWGATWAAPT